MARRPRQIPRAAANAPSANNPVTAGGDFGSLFPWYVDVIKRKVAQNWYTQEVQPGTPAGTSVTVAFDVARDGTVSGPRVLPKAAFHPSIRRACTPCSASTPLDPFLRHIRKTLFA